MHSQLKAVLTHSIPFCPIYMQMAVGIGQLIRTSRQLSFFRIRKMMPAITDLSFKSIMPALTGMRE